MVRVKVISVHKARMAMIESMVNTALNELNGDFVDLKFTEYGDMYMFLLMYTETKEVKVCKKKKSKN